MKDQQIRRPFHSRHCQGSHEYAGICVRREKLGAKLKLMDEYPGNLRPNFWQCSGWE
jgi:hypothetical protein